jgi:tetratricopeptide (TPR) repeat protein
MKSIEERIEELLPAAEKIYPADKKEDLRKMLLELVRNKDVPPFKALGITSSSLDFLSAYGDRQFKSGKFMAASDIFSLLARLDPQNTLYEIAIGHCFYKMNDFISAIPHYLRAATTNRQTANPFYYLGDCYMKIKDPLLAYINYQNFLAFAGDDPSYQPLKEKVNLILKNLESQVDPEDAKQFVTKLADEIFQTS